MWQKLHPLFYEEDEMKKKRHLYKRILSALLVGSMLFTSVTTTYASKLEEAKDKRDEAQEKLDEVNKEINKLNEAQEALQAEMDAYDEALMALLTDLTLLEEDIANKEAEIIQAGCELEAAEEKEAEQYEFMKRRIRHMYVNAENQSVWTAFVGASNFTEVLNRAEYIAGVYEYDREQLTEYQETVQEITELKATLDEEMIALGELQVNMEEQQSALQGLLIESAAKMENMEEELAEASALAKKYAKTIKQQNKFIETEEARLASENKEEAGGLTGGSNPAYSSSVSGQDVVNYASQFVGNPYVFGGNSLTNGCDCSYFTMACFGNFGISLPRNSYQQRSSGQAVSYANAKAGDIICYAGHVAIYMGNGKIVHAANSRLGICYGTATYRTIVAVRRVL